MTAHKPVDKAMFLLFIIITCVWLTYLLNVPFHEDEAIYAAWSLALLKGDLWFSQTLIDKPPLTFYPMALSIGLFGRHEWAARLPNLFWTVLLLVSCWRVATFYRLSGKLPIVFMLLSPLLWAQAASAFTDLAMLALVFFALERAVKNHIQQAGGLFGFACLAKPTAILLLPLIIIGLLIEKESNKAKIPTKLSRFVAALTFPLLLAWAWDASRSAPSWWALGAQAYGTLGELNVTRIEGWLYIFLYSLGPLLFFGFIASLYERTRGIIDVEGTSQHQYVKLVLGVTSILWVPMHLLLGFQPWERYLLPLVPMLALFFTFHCTSISQDIMDERHEQALFTPVYKHKSMTFAFACVLLSVPLLINSFQIEPHDGRWKGIREVGAILETLPHETTVYYLDTGRPLAWYATNAKASLVWTGSNYDSLPSVPNQPSYLVIRTTQTLPTLTNNSLSLINQSGNFRILKIKSK